MNFNPLDLLIGALAVWRVSAMLAYERGPFRIFEWLRERAGIFHFDDGSPDHDLATKEIQRFLICAWCSSPYFAALFLFGYSYLRGPTMIVSAVLALSAGAIIVERINHG